VQVSPGRKFVKGWLMNGILGDLRGIDKQAVLSILLLACCGDF
jgi:hypothetical protein